MGIGAPPPAQRPSTGELSRVALFIYNSGFMLTACAMYYIITVHHDVFPTTTQKKKKKVSRPNDLGLFPTSDVVAGLSTLLNGTNHYPTGIMLTRD